jgi:hypothetical protein
VAKASRLDLGVTARTILAIAYVVVQGALLATASARPDGVFAFRMFNESSTISIDLFRRIRKTDGTEVLAPTDGRWQAKDESGAQHSVSWNDRVRDPILGTLGRPVHAAYGVDAQLFRLQHALDDFVETLTGDRETTALVARVGIVKNGRPRTERQLESARR